MKLNKIELLNYRNIKNMEIIPGDGINVFYGDNAQGKTNLIEAIWLFTGNNSFRGAKAAELIMFDQDVASLAIDFSDQQRNQKAKMILSSKKKLTLNNVELKSMSELNGNFYAVVFSPAHLSFIKDGPKNRRRFIDIAVSQIKPQYDSYMQRYEKLIDQRNALLKNSHSYQNLEQNIEVWDLQLAKIGTIISIYRNDYIHKLEQLAKKIYEGLSSKKENFTIHYVSTVFEQIKEVTVYDDDKVMQYQEILKANFQTDVRQGYTTIGIHRDDLDIFIDGKSVKTYGSQGQQRSSVIALKLAEAQLLKKVTGENPIMLLDDVMSELDVSRQDYILNHVRGMQVFITCCDVSNTLKLNNGCIFKINNGALQEFCNIEEKE
ncbi:MAG: DNA replication/repair protein RecF [Oscillospiraceae bacterium]